MDDGFISFTDEFKYLGSLIHQSLTSDADVTAKLAKAAAAFGALRQCFFSNRLVRPKEKGQVYITLILTILLYRSAAARAGASGKTCTDASVCSTTSV